MNVATRSVLHFVSKIIDSKQKRAHNLAPIEIQIKAKNSNKLCISYGTKAAKVTKNSTVLQLA